jgi:L-alanine-DL-glutamate epimerase-like enolase superfamily enzyme
VTVFQRIETEVLLLPLGHGWEGEAVTQVHIIFVTVTDSDGTAGTGFTYAYSRGGAGAVRALIEGTFTELVLGCDVLDWDRLWHLLWAQTHRLGRGIALPALSALDIAVWDVRGLRENQPIYRLLGAQQDSVPIYGTGRTTHAMSVDELIAGAKSYVEQGFKAVKLRAGARPLVEDVDRVTRVREALGDAVTVMVDVNERLSYPEVLRLGRRLEELDIAWLEEPLISDDIAGHARLAASLRIPVAAGEHLLGRFEFSQYLQAGAAAVLQPDSVLTGGFTECRRIATLAEVWNLPVAPHFLPELHIHLALATKNCHWVEHFPLIEDLLAETLTVVDGRAIPPERSGHGMLWNRDVFPKYTAA